MEHIKQGLVQAGWQSLDEGDRHQLPTGFICDDDCIIQRIVGSTFDGFGQNVSDTLDSLSPSRIKIAKLNSFRVLDKPVALSNMAIISGHTPQQSRPFNVPCSSRSNRFQGFAVSSNANININQ
ncbi:hypothetical protein JKG68_09655 [Microvirga aerilata]|uniref:Uncharacterized protein n=1 Tax=Microvirga aerilata TaxID=670292 RepID=A0A936Z7U9_9HYPH|nr:hypothetical protein [Microvirga aerilata]MBL0404231.1 hypothetical protein [Microvirga aerilata]